LAEAGYYTDPEKAKAHVTTLEKPAHWLRSDPLPNTMPGHTDRHSNHLHI